MNTKTAITISAISGFLAVGLGAFGAHALKSTLIVNGALQTWQTASNYHLIHSVVLMALAFYKPLYKLSFLAFALGVVLFSGSLYALALTSLKLFAFITPIGGVAFLLGWVGIVFYARKAK